MRSCESLEEKISLAQAFGLRFNPFCHLEASRDTHLLQYMVDPRAFNMTVEDRPALTFSPPGGGKTALRIYITRSAYVGVSGRHAFPVPYVLPSYFPSGLAVPWETHLQRFLQASARALLVSMVYRPERYLDLESKTQAWLAGFVNRFLPGRTFDGCLSYYVSILQECHAVDPLLGMLHWNDPLAEPPTPALLDRLALMLERVRAGAPALDGLPAPAALETLAATITGPLKFRALYWLVDGVDSFIETSQDPQAAVDLVGPIFARIPALSGQQIAVKGFLPAQISAPLLARLPELAAQPRFDLAWSDALLVELIQKRLLAASAARLDSLDAYCSAELSGVEAALAARLDRKLPRNFLELVQDVLAACVLRTGGQPALITEQDLDAGLLAYQQRRVSIPA